MTDRELDAAIAVLIDAKRLWAALHGYLIAQNTADPKALSEAYALLVDEHNAFHARYVAPDERAAVKRAAVNELAGIA